MFYPNGCKKKALSELFLPRVHLAKKQTQRSRLKTLALKTTATTTTTTT